MSVIKVNYSEPSQNSPNEIDYLVREDLSSELEQFLLNRANHSGTQAASTISNFAAEVKNTFANSATATIDTDVNGKTVVNVIGGGTGSGMIYNPNHFYLKDTANSTDTNTFTNIEDCFQAIQQLGALNVNNRALVEISPTKGNSFDAKPPRFVDLYLHSGAMINNLELSEADNNVYGYGSIEQCLIANANTNVHALYINNLKFNGSSGNNTIDANRIDVINIGDNASIGAIISARLIKSAEFLNVDGYCKICNANFVNDNGSNVVLDSINLRLYLVKCHLKSNINNIILAGENQITIDNCILHSGVNYTITSNGAGIIHVLGSMVNREANPSIQQTFPNELLLFTNLQMD